MAGMLGIVSSVVGIAGGINTLTGGSSSVPSTSPGSTTAVADPFAPYRGGVAAQYAGALASGGTTDPTQMPGYSQWKSGVLDPSLSATQGKLAASGMSMSGTESQALQGVAQQGYYGFMTDYMNRLAQGSGAANNPAPAAGMGIQQGNAAQAGIMQGLGGLYQGYQGMQSAYANNPNTYNDPSIYSSQPAGGGSVGYAPGGYGNPADAYTGGASYSDPSWVSSPQ